METTSEKLLTKNDVLQTYLRWWWCAELSNSFERMQGLAFGASFASVLKKLYSSDEEKLKKALKRHLVFFNTQPMWGCLIHGSVLAMEEQKASGDDIPSELIADFKTGLMGPLAGIGDAIDAGTFQAIFTALGASFAAEGNIIGAFFVVLWSIINFFEGLFFFKYGYRLGKKSISMVLQGGLVNSIIKGGSILGMFMMGALSAAMVSLSTTASLNISGKEISLQETLDKIAPGLLPLALVFFVYWGMTAKKWTASKLLWILIIFSLLGSLIRLF
ncbi:PTS system mannose/fructose/sorbose family transporter subunit IID [Enterococcus sp. AZ109]|uniref:PTS system mannose/fructose/sorbose family transporter subunit IID n=1 Tax=Enterococcus sp. AZ109 TaxID=2774634 RepID=UPI003F29D720